MRHLLLVLSLIVFAIPQRQLWSQHGSQGVVRNASFGDLFHSQRRPSSDKPIPVSASFFGINTVAFDRLVLSYHPSIVVENVQLNSRLTGTLMLKRFDVLSPGASVVAGTPGGDRPAEVPQGFFYSGSVREISGSYVYLALFRDYCSGYIEVPTATGGLRRYTIAPLKLVEGSPSTMVIYDEEEALFRNRLHDRNHWECGSEHLEEYEDAVGKAFGTARSKKSTNRLQSNNMLVAQIALDGDSAYYVAHGRSLSRAVQYALTVMGATSAIYQRDINLVLQVPYLRIWTGRDPYPATTSSSLLPQFKNYWSANMSGVQRTLAHMLSVSAIGGGIAYVNTLCSYSSGYAVLGLNNSIAYPTTAYVWDTDVTAHEMGHNFGSPHTHSCNWIPAIDSCYTAESGTCFTGTSQRLGTIMSYCHLTPFGTQLHFHPRVSSHVRSKAEMASCITALENSAANDVAVASIEMPAPGGRIASGAQFVPAAVIKNAGTNSQSSLAVNLTVRDSLGNQVLTTSSTLASLAPGATARVTFNQASISTIARYSVTVVVTLSNDAYPTNNTQVQPFEVVSSTSGTLTLTAPNAATIFRAGETATITWNYSGSINGVRLDFTPDDGATWLTVAMNLNPTTQSASWIVPAIATRNGRIRISDRDNSAMRDESDVTFAIEVQPLEWQWARGFGGLKEDEMRGIGQDSRGNVYVTGSYVDSMMLGTTKLTSAGGRDIYLAKYSAGGTFQWAKSLGGVGQDSSMGLVIDGSGEVAVTGNFQNSMTLGSTTLTSAGAEDVFVAKYAGDGTLRWAQRSGGTGRDQGRGIAVDASGNMLVTGLFSGTASFGSSSLTAQGGTDAFVAKYRSTDGVVQWAQRAGGSDIDEGNGIAVDATGSAVIAGRYRGSGSFGGTALSSAGGDDGFVAKYNSSGTAQWGATLGGNGTDEATGVTVDAANNVFVTGSISNTVNFGNIFITSTGGRDIFLARYGSTGAPQWVRTAGGISDDYGTAITSDGNNNIYLAGYFQGTLSVADANVTSIGGSDVVAMKFAADGGFAWVRSGGGTRAEEAYAITINTNGDNAYVGGRYSYAAGQPSVFASDSLHGLGLNDGFVVRVGTFKITAPKENDVWPGGGAKTITWTTSPAVRVKIEYSSNNGTDWNTVSSSEENDGSYTWTLPNINSTSVVVRVSDIDNPAVYGTALSGTFSIGGLAAPTNLTATPMDGAVDLAWTGSGSSNLTGYAIYRGTTIGNMARITTVDTAQRTYRDYSVVNCTDYVYGVKAISGAQESGMSNTVNARPSSGGSIEVTNPVAGERVAARSAKNITWNVAGCIANVKITYSITNGSSWNTVIDETPNDGSYSWTVPDISAPQTIVRVADAGNANVYDDSPSFIICNLPSAITVTGATSFCEGSSTVLSAPSGFASYLWSNGATTRDLTVTQAGSYSVTVTDAGGCSGTSSLVTVTRLSRPQPSITAGGPTTFCQGGSVVLSAPTGFSSYSWSNGATTRQITVTASGSYTVTVIDANGCSGTSAATAVTVHANPTATISAGGPTTFCEGGSVVLSAPSGFPNYLWSNGATTRQITATTAGSYTVRVTNSNGCSTTSPPTTVTVRTRPQPTISASGPTTFCQGGSVVLSAPTGFSSYSWSNGATTRQITVTTSGNYAATVTDGNGCSGTSAATTVTVRTSPQPTVTPNGPTTFCTGGSVVLSAPTGFSSYSWSNGATTRQITVTTGGNYAVTVTDGNGCSGASAATTVTVRTSPQPTITANGPTTFCQGGSVVLSAPTGFSSYSWSNGATTREITVTVGGSYGVTVTDGNGCSGTSAPMMVTVRTTPEPVITASGPTTFCAGGSVVLSAPTGYSSYLWSNGATTREITVTTSSMHNVTVTDGNGCSGTSAPTTVTVRTRPEPVITAGGPTTFCDGGSVVLSAPTGYSSYLWTNGATTREITVTTGSTHTVTVGDGNCNGTSAPVIVTVRTRPQPTITANGPTTFCQGGSVVLSAPTGFSSYSWSNGATTREITVTAGGNYAATVTDGNGCTGTSAPTTVIVRTRPEPVITPNGPTTFCAGGSVVLSAPSGYASYLWSNGATTREITVTTSSMHNVTVTDANGCSGTSAATTVTVRTSPQPSITAGGPTTFCAGGSVVLSAPTGFSGYSWSNGATTREITVTAGGNYAVTVTDGNGCSGTSAATSVTVHARPEPVITANGPTTFCTGGSVVLSAPTGFSSYSWTNGATTREITVTVGGSYGVTVTNGNGCSGTSAPTTVTVRTRPEPVITAGGPTTFCAGGSVVLSAPTGYTSYEWTNGATTRQITVTAGGNYAVTVGDGSCTGTSAPVTVTVHTNPEPVITANGPTTFCQGGSVVLSAPTGFSSYLWSHGATTREITVTAGGNYAATVTDANGCSGTSAAITVTVRPRPEPVITANGPTTFCEGGSVVLSAPTGFTSYLWSNGATTREITVTTGSLHNVTVTDANGCSGTSAATTVTVHTNPEPVITANGPTTFCQGGSVGLSAPAGYASYSWSNGATTREITVTTAGNYTVRVNDANGCTGISSATTVTVHGRPEPVITPNGPTTFCTGGSVVLSAPAGFTSYLWTNGATTREIMVTTSGLHTVTVTDANGCSGTSTPTTVTVRTRPEPVITAGGPTTFCAGGSVVLSAPTGYTSYEWSNGATMRQITVTTGGNYTVTVADGSCSGTSAATTVTVHTNPQPTITAGGPTTFCQGGSVVLSAPTGFSSYSWSNGATTREITVTAGGNYTATVTDANGCAGVSNAIGVTVHTRPEPVITANGPTTFCEGGSVVLSAPAGFTSYLWSNGATTREITVTTSSMHNVTVTDANGCSGTSAATTVTVYTRPQPSITAGGPTTFCAGGSVVLSAPTGFSGYSWSNGATTREITVTAGGNYAVTVTDGNGCSGTSAATSVTVHARPEPVITANGPTTFCTGGSVVLSAPTGFSSYSWTNGATTREITVTTSGLHTVTVTDANGCSGTSAPTTVTVRTRPEPVITAGGPTTFCQGGSVVLSAPTGYTSYEWSNGATTREITVTTGGNYTVTVADGSCSGTSAATTVMVHTNPQPVITANGPTTFCQGGSVVLSAPTGFTSYSWSNGATTREITVTTGGNYAATVVDANGCSGTSAAITVTVRTNPLPVITTNGPTTFCEGGSVVLSAPAGFTSYLWTNGATTREITVTTGSLHTVTVTDANGCSGTSAATTVTVHTRPQPSITAGGPTTFCAGGSVVLSAPTGFSGYSWSNGATTREITVTAGGNYAVTVTDGNGCSGTSAATSVTVHARPEPVITANGPTTFCTGGSVVLSAPTGFSSYSWSNGATTREITVTTSGLHTVTVTAANGCSGTSAAITVTVRTRPEPVITAGGPTTFCAGGSVVLSAPTGYTSYEWSNGATTRQITVTTGGNYAVTVTDGSCSGTSAATTVTVHANPEPVITANGPTTFCEGGNVVLSAPTGFSSYSWSNGATTREITVMAGGNYAATVTDGNGCSGTSAAITVTVRTRPEPVITANGPTTFCEGGSVVLSAPAGYTSYEWSNGATTRQITVTTGSLHTVTVTDANGCSGTSAATTVTVHANPEPVITANGPTTFCQGGSVGLSAPAGYASYLWSNGATTREITVTTAGNYTVRVNDANGCTGISSATTVTVHTRPEPVITPNGPTTFCEGGSVVLSAPAGYTSYEWSNGATTREITVTVGGSYGVTVTDGNGCTGTSAPMTVTVRTRPEPVITAGGPTTFCQGGNVVLSAPTGYTSYEWSNGATTRQITVTSTATLTVTVADGSCTGTSAPVTVTAHTNPQPVITANGPTTFCEGGSVVLSAPTGFSSYLWSNGATTREITVATGGNYAATVTDANGCSGTSAAITVTVRPRPEPVITANGPTTFCEGGSVVLSAPAGFTSYSWSNGATTREITVTTGGLHTVTVTDANGCSGTSAPATVTVHANPEPVITANGLTTFCEGGSVVLSAPTGFTSYLWSNGATTREITVITAGSYTVRVNDANGCTGISSAMTVTVHANPEPVITANGPTEFCTGGSVVLSAPTGFTSYQWSNGATTREITVTTAGNYTVRVNDANGCTGISAATEVTVYERPEPVIAQGATVSFCQGESATLSAPTGYTSYQWSNGATTREITVTMAGNYAVTVTDGSGCTGTSDATVVTVYTRPQPVITANGPTTFCTGGSVVLSAPAGFASYLWSNGATTREITVTTTGSHTVRVTDANGCMGTSPAQVVTVHTRPEPVITTGGPMTFCEGGSVVLSAPAGFASYQWSNGATTREITVTAGGLHAVTVTDANGCTGTSAPVTVTVHANPQPVITANGPTTFCTGESVVLSAPAGYTSYQWSNGATTREITVIASGSYTVRVNDANGCTGISSATAVTVHAKPQPVITAGGPTEFCTGGSVVLSAPTGFTSYLWSNGATTREITVTASGIHTVRVTDANGCTGISAGMVVTAYERPEPVIAQGAAVSFCQGENATLSAPTGYTSYLWSNGATTREITVTTAGEYTVTVTDGSGCSGTSDATTVTVHGRPQPVITANGPVEFCEGGSVVLSAPTGFTSYQWSNGATTRQITVTAAGSYTVTVQDGNSCTGVSSGMVVTVHENPSPVITANGPVEFCTGGSVVLSAPAGFASYQWSNGATTRQITVTASGSYTVRVTDANGCTGISPSSTVRVYTNPSPVITANGPVEFCEGSSVVLSAPAGYTSYLWSNGATTREITVTASGSHTVRVTDANGCTGISPERIVTVRTNPSPVITANGPTTFCQGGSVVLSAPAGYTSYLWSNGATTREITVTASGSHTVRVTDASGCTGISPAQVVTVRTNPLPVITANGPTTFCTGESVVLSAPVGFASYQWSNGATTRQITVTTSGDYTVRVTDANGCSGLSAEMVVTVNARPQPAITANGPVEFCEGGSVTLSAPAGFASYRWSNGATTRQITATASGDYTVTVTDANGCSGSSEAKSVTVNVRPQPTIAVNGPTEFCEGGNVVLTAPAGYASYRWSNGATTRQITVTSSATMTVTVTDARGCSGTSQSRTVTVYPTPQPVIAASGPTTFCGGESVVLSAPIGFTSYRWSNGATTRQITVAESGHYTVTVTNVEGCSGISEAVAVMVTVRPQPVITANGPTEFCEGGNVTLTAPEGYASYRWSNGATTRQIRVDESATFTVTVTDDQGCNGTSEAITITVNPNPRPVITILGTTTFCEGDSVTLRAPEGYASYRWSNGATTRQIVAKAGGTYTVTATNGSGCNGISPAITVTVNPNPQPVIAASGPTDLCEGGSVVLTAPGGYDSYKWSNGAIGREITVTKSGSFRVTVSNTNGCSGMSDFVNVVVHRNPEPKILVDGPTMLCQDGRVTLTAPAGFAAYRWSNGATTRQIVVTQAGDYRVTVTAASGCDGTSETVSVRYNTSPRPTITANDVTTFCEGSSVVLTAPGGYASYRWSTGATTREITVKTGGTYDVTVTDTNGCSGTSPRLVVTVLQKPRPVIKVNGPLSFCEGESVVLSAPEGYISYRWSNGSTASQITVTQGGTYSVQVGNVGGCSGETAPVTVTVLKKPRPAITASGSLTFHKGGSVTLRAPAGYASYRWSDGSRSSSIVVKQSGKYAVTVTTSTGCTGTSDTVEVKVLPRSRPFIIAEGPTALCPGGLVKLIAPDNCRVYRWSTGDTTQTIMADSEGEYSVMTINEEGDEGMSDPLTISMRQGPEKPVIVRKNGGTILHCTVEALEYRWFRNGEALVEATEQSLGVGEDGEYTVQVINETGCANISEPVMVRFSTSAITGVRGPSRTDLTVQPNPAADRFTVELSRPVFGEVRLVLSDMNGREMMRLTDIHVAGNYRREIDITKLSSGIYMLELSTGGETWMHKVVKHQ